MNKVLFICPDDPSTSAFVARLVLKAGAKQMTPIVLRSDDVSLPEMGKQAHAVVGFLGMDSELMKHCKASNPRMMVAGIHDCEHDATLADAVDGGYAALLRNRCTMVLSLLGCGKSSVSRSLVITSERGIVPSTGDDETADAFLDILANRIGHDHNKTILTTAEFPAAVDDDLSEAIRHTAKWAKLSLFPKYEAKDPLHAGAEFGFVAKRSGSGTLITARASNKEAPTSDDFALITELEEDGTIHVTSTGRKASLNAPLAHLILQRRPEIKYVVHAHVFLPEGITVADTSTPGTRGDWLSIEKAVAEGYKIINQPHHGTLVLLERPEELLPILERNSLYRHNSEFYDLAYARFQSSGGKLNGLERAVLALSLPPDARVLDLCCGTGASTLALRSLGIENVDFADGSPSMLAVAEKRLGGKGRVAELEDLDELPARAYDLVTIRQAFAYVHPDDIGKVASGIARLMKPGASLVFNAFAKIPPGTAKSRNTETETRDTLIRTREDNQVTEEDVLHSQRTEIIDFRTGRWDAVMDVNRFFQHPADKLRAAFTSAGFQVDERRDGNSLCYVANLVQKNDGR